MLLVIMTTNQLMQPLQIKQGELCFTEEYKNYCILKPKHDEGFLAEDNIVITTFYHFAELSRPELVRDKLKTFCQQHNILGTILLGTEGINSTICGSRESIDLFCNFLAVMEEFASNMQIDMLIEFKETYSSTAPFNKLKVRVKKEIVSFGGLCQNFNPGNYIEPEKWDEFIKRDDVILVDTRNDYEYDIGTFEGAINPKADTFKNFADWMHQNKQSIGNKKYAMFCTGGIRCELSTSYAKQIGHENVYHLKGGILAYFIKTKNKNKSWLGKCFVFDNRVIVDPSLQD